MTSATETIVNVFLYFMEFEILSHHSLLIKNPMKKNGAKYNVRWKLRVNDVTPDLNVEIKFTISSVKILDVVLTTIKKITKIIFCHVLKFNFIIAIAIRYQNDRLSIYHI